MTSNDAGSWVPDTRTLRWALGRIDHEGLRHAIERDSQLRSAAEGADFSPWNAYADAAVEFIFWDAIAEAERLNSESPSSGE
ncbi:hypothetical protein [Rhodococcus sp. NPDC058481]|uniref:hypothetical protein n=1 Tax=unclassified Rhodococcus (in: high G+C Gram-positive bacteria) TaxID=192944 RepID=UPI003666C3FC